MNSKIIFSAMLFLMFSSIVGAASEYGYLIDFSSASFLPSTVHAGDTVSVVVDITNKGSSIDVDQLSATLQVPDSFDAVTLEDFVGLLRPGETQPLFFKFTVPNNSLPSHYPALLTVKYMRDGSMVSQDYAITIPVSKAEKKIEVTASPNVINPGNISELAFSLKNLGGSAISNVSFSWEESNDLVLPLGSDNKRYLNYINAGESSTVVYNVAADPNITPGIYPLDVSVSFIDSNGTNTQSSQVGLIIGGGTDFEVSAESLSSGEISVTIANIGSNNAESVVVKIPEQQGINISGNSVEILGNLNKGDFTIANFNSSSSTQSSSGSSISSSTGRTFGGGGTFGRVFSGTQQSTTSSESSSTNDSQDSSQVSQRSSFSSSVLLVQIDYTDTTGSRQSITKEVAFNNQSSFSASDFSSSNFRNQDNGLIGLIPWVLMGLILGAGIAYNYFKGKRDWKDVAIALALVLIAFVITNFLFPRNLVVTAIVTIVSCIGLYWYFLKFKSSILSVLGK